jgi:nuclear pore complex protein Nup62
MYAIFVSMYQCVCNIYVCMFVSDLCVHGCMYVCLYIYIYIYVCMYLHACVHVYLWMYLYVDIYMVGKKIIYLLFKNSN